MTSLYEIKRYIMMTRQSMRQVNRLCKEFEKMSDEQREIFYEHMKRSDLLDGTTKRI